MIKLKIKLMKQITYLCQALLTGKTTLLILTDNSCSGPAFLCTFLKLHTVATLSNFVCFSVGLSSLLSVIFLGSF